MTEDPMRFDALAMHVRLSDLVGITRAIATTAALAPYRDDQLELLLDFLSRIGEAAHAALAEVSRTAPSEDD